jgi:hypothetical protein
MSIDNSERARDWRLLQGWQLWHNSKTGGYLAGPPNALPIKRYLLPLVPAPLTSSSLKTLAVSGVPARSSARARRNSKQD